ncbi:MAG: hypothetical protein ACFFFH_17310 [Candidatus Thorarchaeota archaeon]
MVVIDQLKDPTPINAKPFTPFIILSPDDQEILYFTQTFAHLTGLFPSITPRSIPTSLFQNLNIQYYAPLKSYEIHLFTESPHSFYANFWIEELIHELRTASLTVDLGAHVLAGNEDQAPLLLQKLLRASHRQRVSTLIASDFLQLQTNSPIIRTFPFVKILTSSLSHSPFTSKVRFVISSPLNTEPIANLNPIIWGNFYFLSNFFTTLYSWLKTKPITMEMTTINPVSVKVTISIPEDQFLSDIQGYSLIPYYLHFIVAYFNGCSWVTQNAINILFPLA